VSNQVWQNKFSSRDFTRFLLKAEDKTGVILPIPHNIKDLSHKDHIAIKAEKALASQPETPFKIAFLWCSQKERLLF